MKIQYIAMITTIILLLIVGTAQATYTIEPDTKGWYVNNISDESYTIKVTNTDTDSVVLLECILQTYKYIENETTFHPLPSELMQYITISPKTIDLIPNETALITVHISLPDVPEMYGHTWEFHILFNDTNKYNLNEGSIEMTQKLHISRIFLPDTKPFIAAETPFYVYPFIIIFSLIMLGGIVMYLRRRSVPLALRDHETHDAAEWAGMQFLPDDMHKKKEEPTAAESKLTPELKAFVEDPTNNPLPEPKVIRKPVRIINGKAKARPHK